MPLKLNVGLSRKVGEANYGSRGATVNLEIELESSLVSQPDQLHDRIRQLFRLAKSSVDDELNGHIGDCVTVHVFRKDDLSLCLPLFSPMLASSDGRTIHRELLTEDRPPRVSYPSLPIASGDEDCGKPMAW